MNTDRSKKAIVLDFYKRVLAQGDTALADELIADDYVQHNPMVRTGKAGFMEALAYLKQLPKSENSTPPQMRIIEDGDYVAAHVSLAIAGTRKCVVDLFRLENGKLAEHWDVIQDVPAIIINGHSMTDGTISIDNTSNTKQNKKLVEDFYRSVFVERKVEAINDFVAEDLVQHNPVIANGREALKNYLISKPEDFSAIKIHRVIGEGNFVLVQAAGTSDQKPFVFYEIFRLDHGQVAEQWSVRQMIPEKMLHSNGMI